MEGRYLLRTRDVLIAACKCVVLSPYSLILGIVLALLAANQSCEPWEAG